MALPPLRLLTDETKGRLLLASNPRVRGFYEKDPEGTSIILNAVLAQWGTEAISEEGLLDSSAMVGILIPRPPTVSAGQILPHHEEGTSTPKRRKTQDVPSLEPPSARFTSPQSGSNGTFGHDAASLKSTSGKKSPTGAHPMSDLEYTAMLQLAASGLASPAQLLSLQQAMSQRSLPPPGGLTLAKPLAQPSFPSLVDEKEERIRAMRKLSPAIIVRNSIEEMILERRPAYRPRLGGRLAQAFENPRRPFGTGAASDALDACLAEFKRDYPNLHAEVLSGKGLFPEAKEKWAQDCLYHTFCYWTRRLVRPVLIAQVDAWRRELAVVDEEAAPLRFGPDDLDKELKGLKDVGGQGDGVWFIAPAWKDAGTKRPAKK